MQKLIFYIYPVIFGLVHHAIRGVAGVAHHAIGAVGGVAHHFLGDEDKQDCKLHITLILFSHGVLVNLSSNLFCCIKEF